MEKSLILKMQRATEDWLKTPATSVQKKIAADVESFRQVLRFHENRYYVQNDPLISDAEYDQLYSSLEKFEKENPSAITPDSPTQRVGSALIKDFKKVQHLVPMLSLQNSYNEDDLRDWDRKVREGSGLPEVEYCVEPKFDGASISLVYHNDVLERAATRGDGDTGDDITVNVKRIRSLPLRVNMQQYGIEQMEIRGEVLMTKKHFNDFNVLQAKAGLPALANPRNAASGSLRIKDPAEVGRRNLEAFVYHVGFLQQLRSQPEHHALSTHSGTLEMLWDLGFRSPVKEMKVLKGINAVLKFTQEFESKRDDLPYEIDGMVIKVNAIALQEKLGMTSHHPRWAIAFKFKARQATSKLLAVTYQVGRTGAITPVAKIEPAQVGGVTVTSISIHNEEYIREKDLRIGDAILIERSGDVIPQIVKSLPDLRTGKEKRLNFPTTCPVCEDELFKAEDEAVWRCININCPAQVVEGIIHFVSKDAMDIRSLGEANVRRFFELGLLKDIPGGYSLDFSEVMKLEGMGERSANTLKQAIEQSKTQPLHRVIYALGIRYVGETTAKTLAHQVNHLMELADMNEEQLQTMDDVGVKVASSIRHFFDNEDNLEIIRRLESLGVQLKNQRKETPSGGLSGKSFLFTGTLEKLKRSDAEEMVEQLGGKIIGSVSAKLNYLVVGENAGSKLEKAKKLPTIQIISEEEFLKMLPT